MTIESLAASHAIGKCWGGCSFFDSGRGECSHQKIRCDIVINASWAYLYGRGTIRHDSRSGGVFPASSGGRIMNYAPISGLPDFLDACYCRDISGYQHKYVWRAVLRRGVLVVDMPFSTLWTGQKVLVPIGPGNLITPCPGTLRGTETYNVSGNTVLSAALWKDEAFAGTG